MFISQTSSHCGLINSVHFCLPTILLIIFFFDKSNHYLPTPQLTPILQLKQNLSSLLKSSSTFFAKPSLTGHLTLKWRPGEFFKHFFDQGPRYTVIWLQFYCFLLLCIGFFSSTTLWSLTLRIVFHLFSVLHSPYYCCVHSVLWMNESGSKWMSMWMSKWNYRMEVRKSVYIMTFLYIIFDKPWMYLFWPQFFVY